MIFIVGYLSDHLFDSNVQIIMLLMPARGDLTIGGVYDIRITGLRTSESLVCEDSVGVPPAPVGRFKCERTIVRYRKYIEIPKTHRVWKLFFRFRFRHWQRSASPKPNRKLQFLNYASEHSLPTRKLEDCRNVNSLDSGLSQLQ